MHRLFNVMFSGYSRHTSTEKHQNVCDHLEATQNDKFLDCFSEMLSLR